MELVKIVVLTGEVAIRAGHHVPFNGIVRVHNEVTVTIPSEVRQSMTTVSS